MSKKFWMVLLVFIAQMTISVDAINEEQDFGINTELFIEDVPRSQDLINFRNHRQGASLEGMAIENMLNLATRLYEFQELSSKYNNDAKLIKNDPKFRELKPTLNLVYQQMMTVPFIVNILRGTINSLRADANASILRQEAIGGFEDLSQDLEEIMNDTYSYGDKLIKFLENFAHHFTQNPIIKELLSD